MKEQLDVIQKEIRKAVTAKDKEGGEGVSDRARKASEEELLRNLLAAARGYHQTLTRGAGGLGLGDESMEESIIEEGLMGTPGDDTEISISEDPNEYSDDFESFGKSGGGSRRGGSVT